MAMTLALNYGSGVAHSALPTSRTIGMTDALQPPDPPYHLFLHADELPVAATAIRLLISDEAHQPQIRALAREVITGLQQPPDEQGKLTLSLSSRQMKITYSAVKLLFNDLEREQADERKILRGILDKLPDEHTIHAIQLDTH